MSKTNRLDLFNIAMRRTEDTSIDIFNLLSDFVYCIKQSDYSDFFIFKGGYSLVNALHKYKREDFVRETKDIDIHCADMNDWDEFVEGMNTISQYSQYGYTYKNVEKPEKVSQNTRGSMTIDVYKGDKYIKQFTIDMNINPSLLNTEHYVDKVLSFSFEGYSLETMLADKIFVLSSRKINWRVKDLYDVYVISYLKPFTLDELCSRIQTKLNSTNKELPESFYICDFHNIETIKHAYDKLKGIKNKPDFDVVYKRVLDFIVPIVAYLRGDNIVNYKWDNIDTGWGK